MEGRRCAVPLGAVLHHPTVRDLMNVGRLRLPHFTKALRYWYAGRLLDQHQRAVVQEMQRRTVAVRVPAVVASPASGGDVVSAIGPAVLPRLQVFGGRVIAHVAAAVDAAALLGDECGLTVFLKPALHAGTPKG